MPAVPRAWEDPQCLGSVQNCCRFRKGEIHSKVPKGNAAGRNKRHVSLRDLIPAGVWSMKMHHTTTLVKKTTPRARCMQSCGVSTSTTGLKAFQTSARAALLGQSCLQALSCRWALRGVSLSAGKGETREPGKGKQGAAPLLGTRLQPGCFYSLKNPPSITSSPPAQYLERKQHTHCGYF